MQVEIRVFGPLRERIGRESLRLELPRGASVASAIQKLLSRHPELQAALRHSNQQAGYARIAVNQEFVAKTRRLEDGDEVAILPPVSGGNGGSWCG